MRSQVGVACWLGAALVSPALALVADGKYDGVTHSTGDVAGQVEIIDLQIVPLAITAAPGEAFSVTVPIDGENMTLDFVPHSVRGENFQVLVQIEDGTYITAEPSEERTLRGSVRESKGSRMAGSLLETGLEAKIILSDGSVFWLQPASQLIGGAAGSDYVVYRDGDIVCTGYGCGMDDNLALKVGESMGGARGAACGTGLCTAEMACDADVEYFNKWGSVTGVENRIESVTNTMNLQYESDVDITHVITAIIVRTAEPDPYASSNYITILNDFRNHWQANQGSIQRDLAQLFTGKDLLSSVIGIAYTIGGICTDGAYCVVQSDFSTSFSCVTDLSAHECGHLWGGTHCSSCAGTTMNSSITCTNNFATTSVTEISSHRDSRTCLNSTEPPPGLENDDCADATAVSDGITTFNTVGATTDGPTLPTSCDEGFGLGFENDVWYNYTATCNGTAVISTCNDAVFDTRLAVYSGSGCPAGTLLACNDDGAGCANFTSLIVMSVSSGSTYKIRLGSFDGVTGTGDLTISCTSSGLGTLYQSYNTSITVPDGVGTVADEDIVAFNRDTSTFSLYFDGSDVSLSGFAIDALAFLSTGEILVSLNVDGNVTGLIGGPNGTLVDDSDIIRFTPTSLGSTTAGTWNFYFDGSDVGLTSSDEDIDALTILADGRLLISTTSLPTVTGLTGLADEDLIAFTATSLGAVTSGTWAYHFDGSDVGLSTTNDEDVDFASVNSTGVILLSTTGNFSVTGVSGADEDVFQFTPSSTGTVTAGTYAAFFDGTTEGLATTADVNAGELD